MMIRIGITLAAVLFIKSTQAHATRQCQDIFGSLSTQSINLNSLSPVMVDAVKPGDVIFVVEEKTYFATKSALYVVETTTTTPAERGHGEYFPEVTTVTARKLNSNGSYNPRNPQYQFDLGQNLYNERKPNFLSEIPKVGSMELHFVPVFGDLNLFTKADEQRLDVSQLQEGMTFQGPGLNFAKYNVISGRYRTASDGHSYWYIEAQRTKRSGKRSPNSPILAFFTEGPDAPEFAKNIKALVK